MYTCKVLKLGHFNKVLNFFKRLVSQVRSNIIVDVDNNIEKVALGPELPHSSICV
jgi:hypothetical protein